jgi:signal transduction histidine kinase
MKVIEFRILKPWFQTWWFYMLCLLGLIAVTWGLIKWRMARLIRRKKELQQMVAEKTRSIAVQSKQLEGQLDQLKSQQIRLEEDNRIKARLIAIISHDMLGPLKFMGFMSKKLRDDLLPSDPTYRTVDSMATVTQELESLSVNMLNWIRFHYETDKMKPERFDLSELINESTEIASTLAKEKGIKLFNDITEATYIWQYRQALGVIIYNLAMNAVNYTETGEIRISGQVSNDHFTLLVSDTGKGMSMELVNLLNSEGSSIPDYSPGEIKKFQFGYRIIKDLLQVIHGKLRIDSKLNQGTQIAVEFLAGQGPNYNKE